MLAAIIRRNIHPAALAIMAVLAVLLPRSAAADPSDIEAAARGVVRIVIIAQDGEEIYPVSHGTGFAVTPERVVTNAHVMAEVRQDDSLTIGIVPSDGTEAVYGRLVAISTRNDLALLATTAPMNLPPLTIAGTPQTDSGAVTAVGYPMNVDRAQGLDISDIFRAQPPVKSTGFLSGRRPTRDFDSLLHTAPIARGNSGGPLLDDCGRVVGINSFGAESGSADAEFFFAISTRELLPFLRANDITARVNGMPCRSLADLEASERDRAERAQLTARAKAEADEEATARRQADARRAIEFRILAERENGMALAGLLLLLAMGAGGACFLAHERGHRRNRAIAGSLAGVAVLGAGLSWLSRPAFSEIEDRLVRQQLTEREAEGAIAGQGHAEGSLICVLDPQRSRVTGAVSDDLPLAWGPGGCVNGRTQYGLATDGWSRVFVPDSEGVVSINRFDPATSEYRIERFLLDRNSMERIRQARGDFQAPACGAGEAAAREFGARQSLLVPLLPDRPNERLVYNCSLPASGG